jgi:hypothetical protein
LLHLFSDCFHLRISFDWLNFFLSVLSFPIQ